MTGTPAVLATDDRLLPAAAHLTDGRAHAIVSAAVRAGGGELGDLRAAQVLYRPGRELVVQYQAEVTWTGGAPVVETLLAGTTLTGAPAGTLPVTADDDGTDLEVGVWRYPFDPALPGLATAVTAPSVVSLLEPLLAPSTAPSTGMPTGMPAGTPSGMPDAMPSLRVVSYRPCRRAVVRAATTSVGTDDGGPGDGHAGDTGAVYVKVLPPAQVAGLVERHQRLLAAGLPVPEVLATDPDLGLVVLRALDGIDLRSALVAPDHPLPDPSAVVELVDRLAAVDLDDVTADRRPSLIEAAPRHAALLRRVLPEAADDLDELVARLGSVEPGPVATVHGDLHEAQIRIGPDGSIVGLLDVDDLGPGDVHDDLGRSLGHLIALAHLAPDAAPRVLDHVARSHRVFAAAIGRDALDARIAAALVGLATGPFRSQVPTWREDTLRLIGCVREISDGVHPVHIAGREN